MNRSSRTDIHACPDCGVTTISAGRCAECQLARRAWSWITRAIVAGIVIGAAAVWGVMQ